MKETAHQEVTGGGERDKQKEGEAVTVLSRALVFLSVVTGDVGGGVGVGGVFSLRSSCLLMGY